MIAVRNAIFYIATVGLMILATYGCSMKESESLRPVLQYPVFSAAIELPGEDVTKIHVDDNLRVLWNADDRISIFNKNTYNQQYKFDGQTGDNSGSFSVVADNSFVTGNELAFSYAVYPYAASTSISNTGVISLTLPQEQTYTAESFGPGANAMVAATEGNMLLFKNLCGYLMLKLYGNGLSVSSLTLKGNNNEVLAGAATAVMTPGGLPSIEMNEGGASSVTLNCPEPVALGTDAEHFTEFWFVLPPVSFENGFTLTVSLSNGASFEKSTSTPVTIIRNTRSRMAALEVLTGGQSFSQYLTFTSEGTTTIYLAKYLFYNTVLYYSYDKENWTKWETSEKYYLDSTELTFTSEKPLYICGTNPDGFTFGNNAKTFVASGNRFSVSGSLMSLLNNTEKVLTIPNPYCFQKLFYGCTNLVSPPDLPATSLSRSCYSNMFGGCTSMESTPELPATELEDNCYWGMFTDCISLTKAPALPATALATFSYSFMFKGCKSLVSAPALPATTLASGCYNRMFQLCTSLESAPELPAKALVANCYPSMFEGCTKLKRIKCLATEIYDGSCVERWLSSVSSTGTFIKAPGMNDWPSGVSGIPEGWTIVDAE